MDTGASTESIVSLARLAERCPGLLDLVSAKCGGGAATTEAEILASASGRWHRSDILAALYALAAANALNTGQASTDKQYTATPTFNSAVQQARTAAILLPELRRQLDAERVPNLVVTWPAALREPAFRAWRSSRLTFVELIDDAKTEVVLVFPFTDYGGADEIARAVERAVDRGISVTLLTRYLSEPTSPNAMLVDRLRRRDPSGKRFRARSIGVNDQSAHEVLHAKVITIDGGRRGYVGSANLTVGGLGESIEIGIAVDGSAATALADLVSDLASEGRAS